MKISKQMEWALMTVGFAAWVLLMTLWYTGYGR